MFSPKPLLDPLPSPTEGHTEPPSKWLLIRKRATALLIDAVLVGVLSAALLASIYLFSVRSLSHFQGITPLLWSAFFLGFSDCVTGIALLLASIALVSWLWPLSPFGMAFGLFGALLTLSFGFSSTNDIGIGPTIFSALFTNCFYHVAFESSRLSATPGKLVVGLQVVRRSGLRPGSFQLLFRHACKLLSVCSAFSFPLVYLLFCNRWQLVHDRLTSTAVDLRGSLPVVSSLQRASASRSSDVATLINQSASIPQRIGASLLDAMFFYAGEFYLTSTGAVFIMDLFPIPSYATLISTILAAWMAFPIMVLVLAAFESSPLRATPGKIVAGIQIVDRNGRCISFFQALAKQFTQGLVYVSLENFYGVLFIAGVISCACIGEEDARLLLLSLSSYCGLYLSYGILMCVTFNKGQSIIDKLSDRWVIREPERTTLSREHSLAQRNVT